MMLMAAPEAATDGEGFIYSHWKFTVAVKLLSPY
jgi:hypothetical protein